MKKEIKEKRGLDISYAFKNSFSIKDSTKRTLYFFDFVGRTDSTDVKLMKKPKSTHG